MIGLAGAGLAVQGILGLGQMIGGLVKKKPVIPEAEIPQELFQNMTDAEYWSYIGMPEAQRQRYIEDNLRTGATALAGATDRKGGLGLVSSIAQSQTEGNRNLAEMDTNLRYQNMQNLYARRDRLAEERRYVNDVNRQIKLDERDRRDQLIGAGIQNIAGAAGTLGSAAAMFPESFGGTGLRGLFGDLFKKRGIDSGAAQVAQNAYVKKALPLNPYPDVNTSSQLATSQPRISL